MTQTLTIARRELSSLFYSPIAYVVLGLFALGSTLIFMTGFYPGQSAELRSTFNGIVWLMIFLVPAISMRLISEELRAGTIEPLMTAPISDTQVIVGKWLGAMGFFAVLLVPLLVFAGVLEMFGRPDYGPIFTGLLGLLLVGGLYLAIGTFASAASQNQIIAFILSVFIISVLSIVLLLVSRASFVNADWQQALEHANVNHHFDDFNKGLIDLTNFVYFASGITLFLFLAVKLLESKRWR
jgi:ABC-2 type transport system permease protein